MLLSIVILSYNRPKQLGRILDRFVGFYDERISLVIKDDRSPRLDEIQGLFDEYKHKIDIEFDLYTNDVNLGYDLNLWDSFFTLDSDYIFLLSDDDYVETKYLSALLDQLKTTYFKFYFTPFTIRTKVYRDDFTNYSADNFGDFIYGSILFSGLIFNRQSVKNLSLSKEIIVNCIYSQVIMASLLIYENKGFGIAPSGILFVGGDGENYFGKNNSATDSFNLSDRSLIYSDLKYQKYLVNAVKIISSKTEVVVFTSFLAQYNLRLFGYILRARSSGMINYIHFTRAFLKSHVSSFYFHILFLFLVFFLPAFIAKRIYLFGLAYIRKSS